MSESLCHTCGSVGDAPGGMRELRELGWRHVNGGLSCAVCADDIAHAMQQETVDRLIQSHAARVLADLHRLKSMIAAQPRRRGHDTTSAGFPAAVTPHALAEAMTTVFDIEEAVADILDIRPWFNVWAERPGMTEGPIRASSTRGALNHLNGRLATRGDDWVITTVQMEEHHAPGA